MFDIMLHLAKMKKTQYKETLTVPLRILKSNEIKGI